MNIIILSGPAAVGKTTLMEQLLGPITRIPKGMKAIYDGMDFMTPLRGRSRQNVVFDGITSPKEFEGFVNKWKDKPMNLIVITQRTDMLPETCMAFPGMRVTELRMNAARVETDPAIVAEAHRRFESQRPSSQFDDSQGMPTPYS